MEASVNEIKINGVDYVPKSSVSVNPEIDREYIIVRTRSAGVHAGELVSKDGMVTVLANARRIYYWEGASTLSQLAMEGTSKPNACKFPCEVTEIELTESIERIPCTAKAITSIKGVKIWKS